MLSDRSYMRGPASGTGPGFLAWLLGGIVGVFVLQRVGEVFFDSDALLRWGALSSLGLRSWELWTPLTYWLLHGGLLHLLINALGLFFLGRALLAEIGERRLVHLTLFSALGAALFWIAFNFHRPGNVVGASGVAMAYLAVFACIHPRRPMTFLLFFVLPVTVQPMWLVFIVGGIDLLGLITREIPSSGSFHGVAHSAHLGGLAAGWLFHRFVLSRPAPEIEAPAWTRSAAARKTPAFSLNLGGNKNPPADTAPAAPAPTSRDALRAEVDRILDKINLHGFGSLTDAEKRVLDEARQQLSHR